MYLHSIYMKLSGNLTQSGNTYAAQMDITIFSVATWVHQAYPCSKGTYFYVLFFKKILGTHCTDMDQI